MCPKKHQSCYGFLSRERIKGYSWLCVIFKNLGIDCYSNIFIAILNETLIRFFFLAWQKEMPGGNEKVRSTGVTLCYNFENVALSVSMLKQKKTNRLDLSSHFLPVKKG